MTAAILQFNQHTKHHSTSNNQSDYIDTPMTKEYHQIMIDLLNTEHPFRAVRLAEIFNYENKFELINKGIIRKWKRELKNHNRQNEFLENEILKNEIVEIKIPKSNCGNPQIDFLQNENLEIKLQQLETGYKNLLGIVK